MATAGERARRTGPREPTAGVTLRYRVLRRLDVLLVRLLFEVRAEGLERWPAGPFCLVLNHHNGWDPMLALAATPESPRVSWFGPKETDFSRGFRNRLMAFYGGVIPYNPEKTTLTSAVKTVRQLFAGGGVLGIYAEGTVGFRETELLPFEDGAVALAAASGVPIVPCAIVGSTFLWFRKRVVFRYGEPIPTAGTRGRDARGALEQRVRAAMLALMPAREPRLPRRRPLRFLGDLWTGAADLERRRAELGE
jgi:1-acyl-sn-glycerol-3-phosphate acyltransferase